MKIEQYPYRVRAWWGEVMVAQSDTCLCLEQPGEPSVLYFPHGDIDLAPFNGTPTERAGAVGTELIQSIDADDVLAIVTKPAESFDQLIEHGTFDPARVRVEVLDGLAHGERDVTTKHFPTWGDAADLVEMLDVRPDGDGHYVSTTHSDGLRPVVEGSQMLGQAIVAASRHAPGRRVVSAGMLFLRPADATKPLRFELDELSSGRVFAGLAVKVWQDQKCCAAGTLLLDATAPEIVRHDVDSPQVPGPYECPPYDMSVTGRDVRIVDGAYDNSSDAPVGPPTIDAWVRFHCLPDDPPLHAGLLAQFTGHMSIAAALRPHPGVGQDMAHRSLSMAVNSISISLHSQPRADEWMLYHHLSTFAGDGMTHSECRVHAEDGRLLASFTVDAMIRPFPGGDGKRDERTAL